MKKSLYRKYQIFLILGACLANFGFFSKISAQESLSSEAVPVTNQQVPQWGYYTIRRDFRKCISPICGGFFIKQNNLKLTPCVDGVFRKECYVSSIDWNSFNVGRDEQAKLQSQYSNRLILRGNLVPERFDGFGEFGKLIVKEAFVAATDAPAKGTFVALKDNGIVCVTEPCFSTDKLVLNKPRSSTVSSIDLSQVGATQQQIEVARKAIFNQGLIAVGKTEKTGNTEAISGGINFVATQFYLRVGIKQ
ncbi:MAG: hypothetical protein QNJ51_18665 [Calothrix sp. MO_167.B12]|nr:hypothetical protein [Calothrix sp. MO_167.B12]